MRPSVATPNLLRQVLFLLAEWEADGAFATTADLRYNLFLGRCTAHRPIADLTQVGWIEIVVPGDGSSPSVLRLTGKGYDAIGREPPPAFRLPQFRPCRRCRTLFLSQNRGVQHCDACRGAISRIGGIDA